jgi:hypothetical protein
LYLFTRDFAPTRLGTLQLRADPALEVEAELRRLRDGLVEKDELGGHTEKDDHQRQHDQVVSTTTHTFEGSF